MKSLARVTLCAASRAAASPTKFRLAGALLPHDSRHRARIRVPHRLEAGDDAGAVVGGAVLAHLPLSPDVEDLDLDADNRPALQPDEIGRRVADRPGLIAPPLKRSGELLDLSAKP